MSEKPEALRLAEELEAFARFSGGGGMDVKAAAELRRLHAENERLREALEMIAGYRPCVIDGFKRGFMPGAEIAKAALRQERT